MCDVRFKLIKAESLYGKTLSGVLHDGVYRLFKGDRCLEDMLFHCTRVILISHVPLSIM